MKDVEFIPQMGSVPHKKVADSDAAWKVQEQYGGQPHCWVQWKGTDVCMDFYCKCGNQSHIDDSFAYFVKCPYCKTVYMCNGHIELIELEKEPDNCVITPDLEIE